MSYGCGIKVIIAPPVQGYLSVLSYSGEGQSYGGGNNVCLPGFQGHS
jgi:hypothetical protein